MQKVTFKKQEMEKRHSSTEKHQQVCMNLCGQLKKQSIYIAPFHIVTLSSHIPNILYKKIF